MNSPGPARPAVFGFLVVVVGLLFLALPGRAVAQTRSYVLRWTAPGDDSTLGRAAGYDVRFSLFPITTSNWSGATPFLGAPLPSMPGTQESFTVTGLNLSLTYYVAVRTRDERGNISKISNQLLITPVQTTGVPGDSTLLHFSAPWPNPARFSARMSYALSEPGPVEIEVYDIAGHRVRTLASGMKPAGAGELTWNLTDDRGHLTAPGMYFVRARLPGLTTTRSLVVMH